MILLPDCSWSAAATIVPPWGTVMGTLDVNLKEALQTLNDEFDTEDGTTTSVRSVRIDDEALAVPRFT